jgi:hypothetical protein
LCCDALLVGLVGFFRVMRRIFFGMISDSASILIGQQEYYSAGAVLDALAYHLVEGRPTMAACDEFGIMRYTRKFGLFHFSQLISNADMIAIVSSGNC